MAKIEFRHFNIAGSNYYHTYLVFIDDNGMRREIHGDPYDRAPGAIGLRTLQKVWSMIGSIAIERRIQ